ncbi:MAG: winged helix-turn-helix domain-containing protein [Asgard group archaeon]|nr:winged helix-turn-helix domain-containing protein [Asgard group archaeon]
MDWDTVSFVTGSQIRFKILIELNKKKATPSELAKLLKYPISHISTTLSELEEKELVICLTKERRKNKYFDISKKGRELLKFINKETRTDFTSEK